MAEKGPFAVIVRLIRPRDMPPRPRPRLALRSSARSSRSSALILEARSRLLSSSSLLRSASSLRTFLGLKRLGPREVAAGVWGVRELVGVERPLEISVAAVAEALDAASTVSSAWFCEGASDEGTRSSEVSLDATRPPPPLPAPRNLGGIFISSAWTGCARGERLEICW